MIETSTNNKSKEEVVRCVERERGTATVRVFSYYVYYHFVKLIINGFM